MTENTSEVQTPGALGDRIVEFDPESESPTDVITAVVAESTNVPYDSLPPLEGVIDGEALDRLVSSVARRGGSTSAEITLTYHGFVVSVQTYGVIELADRRGI